MPPMPKQDDHAKSADDPARGSPRAMVAPLAALAVLLFLDQAIKVWVRLSVPLHSVTRVIPNFIDLTRVENPGISFSMLGELGTHVRVPLLVGVSLVAVVLIARYWWRQRSHLPRVVDGAFVPILAGAVGNLIDRALFGTVTDYLHFRFFHFSFFVNNLADIYISLGVVTYLLALLRYGGRRGTAPPRDAA